MNTKSSTLKFLEKLEGRPMTVAAALVAHRMAEDLTQEALAKQLNISRVHLSQLEKGHKFLSPERAYSFAKKIGYPAKVFVELSIQDQLTRAGLKYKIKLEAA